MKKENQYYSKIALEYCVRKGEFFGVTRGDLCMMEDLFDLFGGDREKTLKKSKCMAQYTTAKVEFVLNRLDRESQKPDALFTKGTICYNGIVNRPTRCFRIKTEALAHEIQRQKESEFLKGIDAI